MASKTSTLPDFISFQAAYGHNSDNDFTLVSVNIRSLRKYWNEFKIIAETLRGFVDAFVITEINIPEACADTFVLSGYRPRFLSRPARRGGGLAVYVRDAYDVSLCDSTFVHAECLAMKVHLKNSDLILLSMYRPPSNSASRFLLELEDTLNRWTSAEQLCIIGDLNINTLCPSKSIVADYLSILASHGLECTINAPTREDILKGELTSSCLDHIAVYAPNHLLKSCVINQRLADHYFVACRISSIAVGSGNISSVHNVPFNEVVIRLVDHRIFDNLIADFNWTSLIENNTPITAYDKFCEQLKHFEHLSQRTIRKKQRRDHNWLNSDILRAIAHKDNLWKRCKHAPKNDLLRAEFRTARNRVVALLRTAKRQYFFRKFNASARNAKKTWALINDIRGKHTNAFSEIDSLSGNPGEIAESFNRFFASSSELSLLGQEEESSLKDSISASAFLPRLSKHDLKNIIFSFHQNKPPGVDGISARTLRKNFEALVELLLFMLNGFLDSAVFPEPLKTALVKPRFKGGKKDCIENYRPIAVLPILSQIIEKFLLNTMSSFIEKFRILSDRQFGFIQGRGTISLLEEFADELYSAFEHNLFSCALFIDISKAFDTLNHNILLKKLHSLGFRGPFHAVLKNYFFNRSQIVSVGHKGNESSKILLKAGVPQGSILSPLLFNIFMNDFVAITDKCIVFQYADDIVLLTKHTSYETAISTLQNNIYVAMNWFSQNKMRVNSAKTKLVCFRNPLKVSPTNAPVFLHRDNCKDCICTPVDYVNSHKYLGIHFDSNMSWQTHLAYVCSKLRSVAWLLFHIRSVVPHHIKKSIVHALAYGTLRYGITIFAFCSVHWKTRVDTLLKNILKSVAYSSGSKSYENIFRELGFSTFDGLFVQTVVLKHMWNSNFKNEYIAPRILRKETRYVVPRHSTRYGAARRCVYVPKTFNDLPDEVIAATTKSKLKMLLWEL